MMISGPYLDEIRARWEAVRDIAIEIAGGPDGHARLLVRHGARQVELRVTRDWDPASDGDVLFIGHLFSDIPRLLEALESGSPLPTEDVHSAKQEPIQATLDFCGSMRTEVDDNTLYGYWRHEVRETLIPGVNRILLIWA
jgi:hypothetical protein